MAPSREVADAIGEAPARETVAAQLDRKREELRGAEAKLAAAEQAMDTDAVVWLREQISVLHEFVDRLERAVAAEREASGVAAATARVAAIVGVHAEVVHQLDDDARRVLKAAEAYVAAVQAANESWVELELLEREGPALHARFGVEPPTLPRVQAPETHPACVQAGRLVDRVGFARLRPQIPITEEDGTLLRRLRRTFLEIQGTEAYAIIMAVGLPDFPPLTPRQKQVLARRAAQEARIGTDDDSLAVETIKATAPERTFQAHHTPLRDDV